MALHNIIHLTAKAVISALSDVNQHLAWFKLDRDAAAAFECCYFVFDDFHGWPFSVMPLDSKRAKLPCATVAAAT
jgi:hypothetical protein